MQHLQVFITALVILLFTFLAYASKKPIEVAKPPPKPDIKTCSKCHDYPHPNKPKNIKVE